MNNFNSKNIDVFIPNEANLNNVISKNEDLSIPFSAKERKRIIQLSVIFILLSLFVVYLKNQVSSMNKITNRNLNKIKVITSDNNELSNKIDKKNSLDSLNKLADNKKMSFDKDRIISVKK